MQHTTNNPRYLPPEWAPQSAVMLTWPNESNTWFPSLAAVEESFVTITKEISHREKVIISCLNEGQREHIHALLGDAKANMTQVHLYVVPADDVWARDHGPITIFQDNKPRLLDFKFNGWGNKYPCERDNEVTQGLHRHHAFAADVKPETIPVVLEGGSIEVDGQGTLLTTRSCLLAKNRNPQFNQSQIEQQLKEWLGITRVLWLDHGYLAGDDTDGHIDTLARFTDPHTIAYVRCEDTGDEHYPALTAMAAQLQRFVDYQGQPYRLIALPWPQAKYGPDGRRLPATYANFLIINGAVLVPTYDDPADNEALTILQDCFTDREVVGVPCRHIIEQYGSLHCVTMQLPDGVIIK